MFTFSIIICTLNREEVLCSTLRSLASLMDGRDGGELIVVDQTRQHTLATERCLQELADSGVRWERVGFASLTRARNHGIRLASGEFVLFFDDDVEPTPRLIDEHLACYADPAVWGVGGCTLIPGAKKVSRDMIGARELKELEAGRANRFDLDWQRTMTWAPGCNMSFRKQRLVEVGGFDEAFYGMATGEETELCHRIRQAGGGIAFAPSAELVHLINPDGGCRDAKADGERTAQMFDNTWYMMKRQNVPVLTACIVMLRLCRSMVINRKSLKTGAWPQLAMNCLWGARRAFAARKRPPVLPFLKA